MTIFNFNFNKKAIKRQGRAQNGAGFLLAECVMALVIFTVTIVICSTWYIRAFVSKEKALKRLIQLQNLYALTQEYSNDIRIISEMGLSIKKEQIMPRLHFEPLRSYTVNSIQAITFTRKEHKQSISFVLMKI